MSEINLAERRAAIANIHPDLRPHIPVDARYPSMPYLEQMGVMFGDGDDPVVAVDSIGAKHPHAFVQSEGYIAGIQGTPDLAGTTPVELDQIAQLRLARQRLAIARNLGGLHIITEDVFEGLSPALQQNLFGHFSKLNRDQNGLYKVRLFADTEGLLPPALGNLDVLRTARGQSGAYTEHHYPPMNANDVTVILEANMPPGDTAAEPFTELFAVVKEEALSVDASTKYFEKRLARQ